MSVPCASARALHDSCEPCYNNKLVGLDNSMLITINIIKWFFNNLPQKTRCHFPTKTYYFRYIVLSEGEWRRESWDYHWWRNSIKETTEKIRLTIFVFWNLRYLSLKGRDGQLFMSAGHICASICVSRAKFQSERLIQG